MASINKAQVLAQFDHLVDIGELFYTPSKPEIIDDSGLISDIRAIPSFASKPSPTSTSTAVNTTTSDRKRPAPTDGSDIDHSDPLFFIAPVGTTHKLILNKFCVYRPQFLLLTQDPMRRQWERLGAEDVCGAWGVLRDLDSDVSNGEQAVEGKGKGRKHYAIFNSGLAGGSSRKHKHLQILAQPVIEDEDLELLPYREGQLEQLPILAFYSPLDAATLGRLSVEEGGRVVCGIVERQWKMARDAVRKFREKEKTGKDTGKENGEKSEEDDKEEEQTPHNVMITQDFVITIPRRAATIEGKLKGHVVGCQGVLGSVWCAKEEQVEAWKEVGFKNVLRELGIPGRVKYV